MAGSGTAADRRASEHNIVVEMNYSNDRPHQPEAWTSVQAVYRGYRRLTWTTGVVYRIDIDVIVHNR